MSTSDGPRAPRVAIVGAGLMGRWHASAARHAGSHVVAIVDPDTARANALAKTLPSEPAVASDIGSVVRELDVQIAHICSPASTHESLARQAMTAGAHVLMEKPLATDGPTTERLFALADERGVLLCPVHQYVFQHGVLDAQRRLARLGDVLYFEMITCSAGAHDAAGAHREQIALDILPHGLALARRAFQRELSDCAWVVCEGPAGEIRAMTQVDAASLSILVSMSARPPENSLTIRCTRGTIRVDLFHGFSVVEQGAVSRLGKIARPFAAAAGLLHGASKNLIRRSVTRESAYPGLRELVRRFHRATTGLEAIPISARESIDVARTRDILARARGRRVNVQPLPSELHGADAFGPTP